MQQHFLQVMQTVQQQALLAAVMRIKRRATDIRMGHDVFDCGLLVSLLQNQCVQRPMQRLLGACDPAICYRTFARASSLNGRCALRNIAADMSPFLDDTQFRYLFHR